MKKDTIKTGFNKGYKEKIVSGAVKRHQTSSGETKKDIKHHMYIMFNREKDNINHNNSALNVSTRDKSVKNDILMRVESLIIVSTSLDMLL